MINSKVDDEGRHMENKETFSPDQIKLMQTQDTKYISLKRNMEMEKVNKLKASLHLISIPDKQRNTKTIFVEEGDDEEEVEERIERIKEDSEYESILHSHLNRKQTQRYKELQKREDRVRKLTEILDDLNRRKKDNQPGKKKGLEMRIVKEEKGERKKVKKNRAVAGDAESIKPLIFPAERIK